MAIIRSLTYEQVDTAERERLLDQLVAERDNLRYVQSDLEFAARDIANLIEASESSDDLLLAADQCSALAARLRQLAAARAQMTDELAAARAGKGC